MSYSQRKLRRALLRRGAVLVREGGAHTIMRGPTGRQSSIPRHGQIDRRLAKAIARQLDIEWDSLLKELS